MTKSKLITASARMLVLASVLYLSIFPSIKAAVVPVGTAESPGVLLSPGTTLVATPSLAGTVVADKTVAFSESLNTPALFQGTLRSVVVKNIGGTLDFYVQLTNISNLAPVLTGPGLGADIFRLTLSGFTGFGTQPGDGLIVNYRTDGLAGIVGAGAFVLGTKAEYSADRDPGINTGVGIDFGPSHFLGDATNVDSGQTSLWAYIRTNATNFASSEAIISGFGTAVTSSFTAAAAVTPVPETGSALIGLAVLGVCGVGLLRRNRLNANA